MNLEMERPFSHNSKTWKSNWEESRKNYLDWWNGKGLVISMWEHIKKEGPPHENVSSPPPCKDINQFWFDPEWRSAWLHYQLSFSSFMADILPVANTHFGPGSLSAILGADLEGTEDSIWIRHKENFGDEIYFDPSNKWWLLHLELLKACKKAAGGKYFVGCPDLVEGLDTLAGLKGTTNVLTDILMGPELVLEQLRKINDIYFKVFDQI
jgi:hypothetical protein